MTTRLPPRLFSWDLLDSHSLKHAQSKTIIHKASVIATFHSSPIILNIPIFILISSLSLPCTNFHKPEPGFASSLNSFNDISQGHVTGYFESLSSSTKDPIPIVTYHLI